VPHYDFRFLPPPENIGNPSKDGLNLDSVKIGRALKKALLFWVYL